MNCHLASVSMYTSCVPSACMVSNMCVVVTHRSPDVYPACAFMCAHVALWCNYPMLLCILWSNFINKVMNSVFVQSFILTFLAKLFQDLPC